MKTIRVSEVSDSRVGYENINYDLSEMTINNCIGCWSCWWKTPGQCAFHDLDKFYHDYISADKVIFICKPSNNFVSAKLKTLFDRMIPLFLPYTSFTTGESMHYKRYDRYPDIEFYFEDNFNNEQDKVIFRNYVHRVFYQFHSNNITINSIEELSFATEGK
ncbi:flavodoxin family protein [Hydrogenoanaerobacterium sp.]|uniref:flavodoxin family protein n=1 Tax=Hydrogenoanaerobacterium sp. TaxID=2953763 RepID=UPI00289D7E7F|nr:flavodoxin family protein [Hydrogenoanaerobacterium sp.]